MKLILKLVSCIIIFAGILCLQGCPAVMLGAAGGAAATAVAYDHRALSQILEDNKLSNQVFAALQSDEEIKQQTHIVVSLFRSNVLLAGQAPTDALRQRIVDLTKQVPAIKRIYNEITVEAPTSALTQTSDVWITSKVKTQFLGAKGLRSSNFKVVTENGTVFLIGVVSKEQAMQAVNIARHIDGVQKVVKIFEYKTTDSE